MRQWAHGLRVIIKTYSSIIYRNQVNLTTRHNSINYIKALNLLLSVPQSKNDQKYKNWQNSMNLIVIVKEIFDIIDKFQKSL